MAHQGGILEINVAEMSVSLVVKIQPIFRLCVLTGAIDLKTIVGLTVINALILSMDVLAALSQASPVQRLILVAVLSHQSAVAAAVISQSCAAKVHKLLEALLPHGQVVAAHSDAVVTGVQLLDLSAVLGIDVHQLLVQ